MIWASASERCVRARLTELQPAPVANREARARQCGGTRFVWTPKRAPRQPCCRHASRPLRTCGIGPRRRPTEGSTRQHASYDVRHAEAKPRRFLQPAASQRLLAGCRAMGQICLLSRRPGGMTMQWRRACPADESKRSTAATQPKILYANLPFAGAISPFG